jgi:hypothetical protein
MAKKEGERGFLVYRELESSYTAAAVIASSAEFRSQAGFTLTVSTGFWKRNVSRLFEGGLEWYGADYHDIKVP